MRRVFCSIALIVCILCITTPAIAVDWRSLYYNRQNNNNLLNNYYNNNYGNYGLNLNSNPYNNAYNNPYNNYGNNAYNNYYGYNRQPSRTNSMDAIYDSNPAVIGQSCMEKCQSRGGTEKACNDACGTTREEGVFYDPTYAPTRNNQLPLSPQQLEQGEIDVQGLVQQYGGTAGENTEAFNGVDYACFRQCRLEGDSYTDCATICQK
jgi:hypothetical protein